MPSVSPVKTALVLVALASVTLVAMLDVSSARDVTASVVAARETPSGGWSVYACQWNAPSVPNQKAAQSPPCRRLWVPAGMARRLERQGVRLETLAPGRAFRARAYTVDEARDGRAAYWQLATPDGFSVYARKAR